MSTLKVNELDTESGTTITIAAGKTLAGTNIIDASALENNSVVSDTIADNQVTLAKMAGLVRGKLIVGDASGDPSALTVGAADQVLTSDGSDAAWAALPAGGTEWQAVQTASFTAVAGKGYPINTTAAAITMTLPASASVGDTIEVVDYAGTFATNNVTVNPNSLKMKGATANLRFKLDRIGARLVYVDATQGWVAVSSRTDDTLGGLFSVSGGTESTSGLYTVHTFTSSGNAVVTGAGDVDILCVAGAGGGGAQHGGAGGAGGYRYITSVAVTAQTYAIVIGAGGAGGTGAGTNGTVGNVSSGLTYSSAGGGYGGSFSGKPGGAGGSGGGGGTDNGPGGAGNTPSTSPSQGNNGGTASVHSPSGGAGGGGGSTAVGANGTTSVGGVGGAGTLNNLDGNGWYWAGGGGGAGHVGGTTAGAGGIGGGGGGGSQAGSAGAGDTGNAKNNGVAGSTSGPGGAGGANTGGGGGGSGNSPSPGGTGGSGIVIIRYLS